MFIIIILDSLDYWHKLEYKSADEWKTFSKKTDPE